MLPISDGDVTIRPMRDAVEDYLLLVRWRAEPHVHAWWDPDDPAPTLEEVIAHYGPAVRGEEPTTSCVIELDGRPCGYLQFYRWLPYTHDEPAIDVRADADTFGLDIHIGEPDVVGHGIGTRAIELICAHLERDLGASWIALTTDVDNHRAQRAYEKAGFTKVRKVLDTDMRDGHRAVCWLMERRPG